MKPPAATALTAHALWLGTPAIMAPPSDFFPVFAADGSYDIVEMDPVELLAEHTHFCEICGKGQ